MFVLLLSYLPLLVCSLNVNFSVQFSRPSNPHAEKGLQFALLEGQNPVRALRKFYHTNNILRISCTQMIDSMLASLYVASESEVEDSLLYTDTTMTSL